MTSGRDRMRGLPPEASPIASGVARRVLAPLEAFLHVEAASGVVLLVAAALAFALANSPLADAFHHVVEAPVGIRLAGMTIERSLHFWVNDGLMTVFFFVVGLEIRREIHDGELSTLRRAALPAIAAIGGMLMPAALFLAIAGRDVEMRRGWGVPMATDIAFAVGVLALLGERVPNALRVLLLALAIIDDIGAILVIALFYSAALDPTGFAIAGGGVAAILVMQRLAVRRPVLYVVPGVVVWLGMLRSGIHPTVAGVIVGLLTPARAWLGPRGVVDAAHHAADAVEAHAQLSLPAPIASQKLASDVELLGLATREALAPAARLQLMLHPWVAFVVMPLFALSNAGVTLDADTEAPTLIVVGIVVGLVVGKPLGILLASFVAMRLRLATLPEGIGRRHLVVVGLVAGIGFTMALFVASLAFPEGALLENGKLGILVASATAMIVGLVVGRLVLPGGRSAARARQLVTP